MKNLASPAISPAEAQLSSRSDSRRNSLLLDLNFLSPLDVYSILISMPILIRKSKLVNALRAAMAVKETPVASASGGLPNEADQPKVPVKRTARKSFVQPKSGAPPAVPSAATNAVPTQPATTPSTAPATDIATTPTEVQTPSCSQEKNDGSVSGTPTMKKKKRYYKGATYGLYLSKSKRRKKKNKENESVAGTDTQGEESNQSALMGTESDGESASDEGEEIMTCQEKPEQEVVIEPIEHIVGYEATNATAPYENVAPIDEDTHVLLEKEIKRDIIAIVNGESSHKNDIEDEQQVAVEKVATAVSPAPAVASTSSPPAVVITATQVEDTQESFKSGASSTLGSATRPHPKRKTDEETVADRNEPLATGSNLLFYPMPKRSIGFAARSPVVTQTAITANSTTTTAAKSNDNQQMVLKISGTGSVQSSGSFMNNGQHGSGDQVTKFIVMNDSKNNAPFGTCLCADKPIMNSTEASKGKAMFCQAIDCFDRNLVGCCNQARLASLFRSSKRVPYRTYCEVHLARLRRHHCCPGCGVFCTQGEFLECFCVKKQVHLFHKSCQILQGIGANKQHCPHCGKVSDMRCVRLEMNGPVNNSVYYLWQTPVFKPPRAKISLAKLRELPAMPEASDDPGIEYVIPDSKKVLSLAALPFGPTRKQLESLLTALSVENQSPSIRFTNKNFYTVAKNGEVDKVLGLLAQGFDPNYTFVENDNETPLHAASSSGHLVIVHLLIQAGACPNVVNKNMSTPLMLAVENKHNGVVKYLIKVGVALDIRGEDGMTALHLSARVGNAEATQYIINSAKVNINLQDDGGWTALVWATEHKHAAIVKILLAKAADPGIQDDEENVGLHWAAFSGDVNIAYVFLEMGHELNAVNLHGDTALHIAARRDNYECVVLLLSRGADLTLLNKNNESPLMCCPKNSQSAMALKVNCELRKFSSIRTLNSDKHLHRDVSKGKEYFQIPIVNGFDNEPVPVDFMYVSENCETSTINIDRTITSLQSCKCEDDCTSEGCICAAISFRCWYDREGKLVDEFNLLDPPMIFECNRACSCWKSCYNRVVQFGVRARLQVFRSKGKGWAVRPLKDIPKGSFVCEYIGEIITDSEADRREDDSYLFDLDNRDGETYCLDARFYGNVARFINHLCEPNLTPVKVFVDHQDLSFPRIALFANRDIKAFEELGFDYGEKFWVIKYRWFTCDCGSSSCKYSKQTIHQTLENYYKRIREEQSHDRSGNHGENGEM